MNAKQKEAIKICRETQNNMEELIGGAHHEINNLSFIISTSIELMGLIEPKSSSNQEESPEEDKRKDTLATIEKKVNEINLTLNKLREVVKDASLEEPDSLSVREVSEEAVKLCKRRFNNHQVILKTTIDEDFWIHNKKALFTQSIVTLLHSAHDVVERSKNSNKCIELEIREYRSKLQITISDNAQLLSPEEIKNIFSPSHNIRGRKGLSLLLVKDNVEQNGGTLAYKNDKGRNSLIITLKEFSKNDDSSSILAIGAIA